MSTTTVVMVLGLMLLGGLVVLWPSILLVKHAWEKVAALEAEIVRVRKEMDGLRGATDSIVAVEREIDHARDLPALDELNRLLTPPAPPSAPGRPAAGGRGGPPGPVDLGRDGRHRDPAA